MTDEIFNLIYFNEHVEHMKPQSSELENKYIKYKIKYLKLKKYYKK